MDEEQFLEIYRRTDLKGKATIIRVGYIDPDTNTAEDWSFDCRGTIPAIAVHEDGTIRYGGYTADELAAIARDYLANDMRRRC